MNNMNELMYERKVWNVCKNNNVANVIPLIDPNLNPVSLAQLQTEMRKWIEAGWVEVDRDDMNCFTFMSKPNQVGNYMMIQYVPVKESLDNQSNL